MNYYLEVFKKYADFSGRARRAEFWYFALFNFIISLALSWVDTLIGSDSITKGGILSGIYGLVALIPSLAVTARRLHDTNRSGWWMFIALVPLIGWIMLLVYEIQDSQIGDNQYGPNPKGVMPSAPTPRVSPAI